MARPRHRSTSGHGRGPLDPALQAVGADTLTDAIRDAIAPLEEPGIGLRITSEFGWLTGRRHD